MEAGKSFAKTISFENSSTINEHFSEIKTKGSLYKKGVEVLCIMEKNFDDFLGNNLHDYYDGNVNVAVARTEFEKAAKELTFKAQELSNKMKTGTALYTLAKSKLDSSSIDKQDIDTLIESLLGTQKKALHQLRDDMRDGKLDNPNLVKINKKSENLEFTTNIGVFNFIEIEDYNPETTPNKIEIPEETQKFLEGEIFRNRGNIEATDMKDLRRWLVDYCMENQEDLSEFANGNFQNLSPKNAILLTQKIVTDCLEYSYLQASVDKFGIDTFSVYKENTDYFGKITKEQQNEIKKSPRKAYKKYGKSNDYAPIDKLLEINQEGICRNYSQAVKTIFEVFKDLQNQTTTQLTNTYCKQFITSSIFQKNIAQREIIDRHAWNNFYTVLPGGNLDEVVIDATFADNSENVSYTKNRFLFDLIQMEKKGIIDKKDQIAQLEYTMDYGNLKDEKSNKAVCQYIGDYYFKIGKIDIGMKWFMKNPSYSILLESKRKYNLPFSKIGKIVDRYFYNVDYSINPEYTNFFTKYYYSKKDYKKTVDYTSTVMQFKPSYDVLIILIASSIKIGSKKWEEKYYSVVGMNDFLVIDRAQRDEKYPREMKLLDKTYGKENARKFKKLNYTK